jgi:hypothetical protein
MTQIITDKIAQKIAHSITNKITSIITNKMTQIITKTIAHKSSPTESHTASPRQSFVCYKFLRFFRWIFTLFHCQKRHSISDVFPDSITFRTTESARQSFLSAFAQFSASFDFATISIAGFDDVIASIAV